MEEAAELANYLPLSFKTSQEQEYVEFLWDTFETNYIHGKFQFGFLACRMLTMSFVYFNIRQIKQTEPRDFEKCLIGFGKNVETLADRPGIEGVRGCMRTSLSSIRLKMQTEWHNRSQRAVRCTACR